MLGTPELYIFTQMLSISSVKPRYREASCCPDMCCVRPRKSLLIPDDVRSPLPASSCCNRCILVGRAFKVAPWPSAEASGRCLAPAWPPLLLHVRVTCARTSRTSVGLGKVRLRCSGNSPVK